MCINIKKQKELINHNITTKWIEKVRILSQKLKREGGVEKNTNVYMENTW